MALPLSQSNFHTMTPMEGKGLLKGSVLLLALAVLRVGLSGLSAGDLFSKAGEDDLTALMAEVQEVREEASRGKEPLGEGETLDPNRADPADLVRLPGVGRSVAQGIVSHREEEGAFLDASDLLEVSGIGPATLARIEGFLDFSQGIPLELRRKGPKVPLIDPNRASAADLETLPGIGPALARRIIEERARGGPFQTPEDLLRVRGIGPATLDRIRPRLRVGI